MRIVPVYPLVAAALALTSVARADAPAEAILKAIDQRSGQLTAFAGTLRVKRDMENVTIHLKFLRQPERFRLSIDDPRMGKVTFLNDGKASYMQGPDGSFLPAPAELIPIKQIWPNLGGTLSEFVGGIESSKVLPSEAPAPGKPERRVVELVGKERTTRLFVNDDNQIESCPRSWERPARRSLWRIPATIPLLKRRSSSCQRTPRSSPSPKPER